MAYPVYKGNGYLVTNTQGITEQNEADNNVGRYLVRVAEYYLKKGCYENGKNYDQCITDFIKAYRGSSYQGNEAYCTMFVYFLLKKAEECLGIKNPFPTQSDKVLDNYTNKYDVIWGNAYRANKWLFENKQSLYNGKPLPACNYYRYSVASSSSGHWGLCIKVTKDGFYGIEGNIQLANNEGVGLWFYPNSDFANNNQNGFAFYRLNNVAAKTDKDYLYNGSTCEEIKKEKKLPTFPNCVIARQDLLNNYDKSLVLSLDSFYNGIAERYVKIENTNAPQLAINDNFLSSKYSRPQLLEFQRDIQKVGIYPLSFRWKDHLQTSANFYLNWFGEKEFYTFNGKCYVEDDTITEKKEEDSKTTKEENTTDEGSVSTYTAKKKECKTVLFSAPSSSRVKHWNEALRSGMWWADVIGDVDVDYGLRNGSATFYGGKKFEGKKEDLKDNYSGIGFTKLENGVPVYIVNKYHKYAYNVLFPENPDKDDASLVGGNPAIIEVYDTNLPKYNKKEFRDSSFFAKPFNDIETVSTLQIYGQDKIDLYLHLKDQNKNLMFNGSKVSNIKNIMSGYWGHREEGHNLLGTKRDIDYLPLKTFLKTCESNNVTNSSIVIILSDTDFKAIGDEKTFQLMAGMIKMATQFVPGLNAVAGKAIDIGLGFVTELRKGGSDWQNTALRLAVNNIGSFTDMLTQSAQYIAPKEMAWVTKQVNNLGQIETEFTDWFKRAEKSANEFLGKNIPNHKAISELIGLDIKEIENFIKKYEDFINIPTDLTKAISGFKLEDINKSAFHLESYLMINKINKTLFTGKLVNDIFESNNINEVPLMRKLFSTGTADTILQMIPRSEDLARQMVKQLDFESPNILKGDKASAWIAVAMGQKPPKELLATYEIDALTKMAEVQFRNKLQFIMPPSIDKELAECYKIEIQQRLEESETGFVVCKDGWTYDYDLKKCKRDNLFIGYEEDKNTSGGGETEKVDNTCPDGYLMYNGKCYPRSQFTCPEGFRFDESIMKCVPIIDINTNNSSNNTGNSTGSESTNKIIEDCENAKSILNGRIKSLEELYRNEKTRVEMYMKAFRDCEAKYNSLAAGSKDSSTLVNKISNLEIIITSLKEQLSYSEKQLEESRNKLIECNNKQQVEVISKKCEDDLKKIVLERDKLIYELQNSNKEIERLKVENEKLKTSTNNYDSNVELQKVVNERNSYYNDLQAVITKYNQKISENNSKSKEIEDLKNKISLIEKQKVEIVEKIKYVDNTEDKETINKLLDEYNKKVYEVNDYKQKIKECENSNVSIPDKDIPVKYVSNSECNDCDKAKIPSFVEKIERISYGMPQHHNQHEECEEC